MACPGQRSGRSSRVPPPSATESRARYIPPKKPRPPNGADCARGLGGQESASRPKPRPAPPRRPPKIAVHQKQNIRPPSSRQLRGSTRDLGPPQPQPSAEAVCPAAAAAPSVSAAPPPSSRRGRTCPAIRTPLYKDMANTNTGPVSVEPTVRISRIVEEVIEEDDEDLPQPLADDTAVEDIGDVLGDVLGEDIGDVLGDVLGEDIGDVLGEDIGDALSEDIGDVPGEAFGEMEDDTNDLRFERVQSSLPPPAIPYTSLYQRSSPGRNPYIRQYVHGVFAGSALNLARGIDLLKRAGVNLEQYEQRLQRMTRGDVIQIHKADLLNMLTSLLPGNQGPGPSAGCSWWGERERRLAALDYGPQREEKEAEELDEFEKLEALCEAEAAAEEARQPQKDPLIRIPVAEVAGIKKRRAAILIPLSVVNSPKEEIVVVDPDTNVGRLVDLTLKESQPTMYDPPMGFPQRGFNHLVAALEEADITEKARMNAALEAVQKSRRELFLHPASAGLEQLSRERMRALGSQAAVRKEMSSQHPERLPPPLEPVPYRAPPPAPVREQVSSDDDWEESLVKIQTVAPAPRAVVAPALSCVASPRLRSSFPRPSIPAAGRVRANPPLPLQPQRQERVSARPHWAPPTERSAPYPAASEWRSSRAWKERSQRPLGYRAASLYSPHALPPTVDLQFLEGSSGSSSEDLPDEMPEGPGEELDLDVSAGALLRDFLGYGELQVHTDLSMTSTVVPSTQGAAGQEYFRLVKPFDVST